METKKITETQLIAAILCEEKEIDTTSLGILCDIVTRTKEELAQQVAMLESGEHFLANEISGSNVGFIKEVFQCIENIEVIPDGNSIQTLSKFVNCVKDEIETDGMAEGPRYEFSGRITYRPKYTDYRMFNQETHECANGLEEIAGPDGRKAIMPFLVLSRLDALKHLPFCNRSELVLRKMQLLGSIAQFSEREIETLLQLEVDGFVKTVLTPMGLNSIGAKASKGNKNKGAKEAK